MNAKKKTVLLVDDDADFVRMNKAVLEKHGYEVLEAYNDAECRLVLESVRPDIIVLDVMMTTATDGFHLAQALRKDKKTGNIPILMVTSVNESVPYKFEPDSDWLPVDQFIEKPVKPEALLEAVNKRLGA